MPEKAKVIVVGGGNAALTAAIAAAERGADVTLLEKASKEFRGGNSRITAGLMRFSFDRLEEVKELLPEVPAKDWDQVNVQIYTNDMFREKLFELSHGLADKEHTEWLVTDSLNVVRWMKSHQIHWQFTTYFPDAKKKGFKDGLVVEAKDQGEGLINMEFEAAERLGVKILYETAAIELVTNDQARVVGLKAKGPDNKALVLHGSVVLGCGGFESNPEMRVRYLGPAWNNVKCRAIQYNTGEMLDAALRVGATGAGHWAGCHATPIDADSPDMGTLESGDKTNKLAFNNCLYVNKRGKRFMDEGRDWPSLMYVATGHAIVQQPDGQAFQVFDSKTVKYIDQRYDLSKAVKADTLDELASKSGIDPEGLKAEVLAFNAAVDESTPFDPMKKDGRKTNGISPQKSNWANKLENPPYYCFRVVVGITFTYGGLKIDRHARVLDGSNRPIPGLYASGEMTGGFFYHTYPAGSGLLCGAITGRAAGWHAAQLAPNE